MTRTLILGGARSGKSAHAEALAASLESQGKQVVYVATGQAGDAEMAQRIAMHRQRRGTGRGAWTTVEDPLALGAAIRQWSAPDRVVLIDCLTVWLANLLFSEARAFPEVGPVEPPAC